MNQNRFRFDKRKEPRKATGGIKARSDNGEFGKNWWAKRWIRAMENLVDVNRLRRGQRYGWTKQKPTLRSCHCLEQSPPIGNRSILN